MTDATLDDLAGWFRPLIVEPPNVKRGPKPRGETAMTSTQRSERHRAPIRAMRKRCIAVLDMETDPFDNEKRTPVYPFCAELYSDQFGSIVIWEENFECFCELVNEAILSLPDQYTIYAHNGGKFDFMFMVKYLRGVVKFKGRAIMCAKIGNHELRDSLHILPEKLAAWKKDKFDYKKMRKSVRRKFRDEILTYLHSDCVYLFDIVKRFVSEFGLKISIGQAAFTELRKHYKVNHIEESTDAVLRPYFYGGRVECIAGRGIFDAGWRNQPYKLYDVNSMYPFVMSAFKHPIGSEYLWRRGNPGQDTIFVDLSCRNYGALVSRGESQEASTDLERGRFQTTIWEYEMALKHNLIEDIQIHWVIDCRTRTDFAKFIVPMYRRRQETKEIMGRLKKAGQEFSTDYEETKKENILLKYLLTNSFGKFAQNPRRYKEYFYTEAGEKPDAEWLSFLNNADEDTRHRFSFPVERCEQFEVWARPSPDRRYNNVGTAASITGAARAVLMEARQNAVDPIYCDTDSLICRALNNTKIDPIELGAWDLEETFDEVIITGKKQYACKVSGRPDGHELRLKVRCKGADLRVVPTDSQGWPLPDPTADQWQRANAETWQRYENILDGQIIEAINKAPTISKIGEQDYIRRRIRATAPIRRMNIAGINARKGLSNGTVGI